MCRLARASLSFQPSGWKRLAETVGSGHAVAVASRNVMESMGAMLGMQFRAMGPPAFAFRGHHILVREEHCQGVVQGAQRSDDAKRGEVLLAGTIAVEKETDLYAAVQQAARVAGISAATLRVRDMDTEQGYEEFVNGNVQMYCGGLVQTVALLQSHQDKCRILFGPRDIGLTSWNYLYGHPDLTEEECERLGGSVLQLHRRAMERLWEVYELLRVGAMTDEDRKLVSRYSRVIRSLWKAGEDVKDVHRLLELMFGEEYSYDIWFPDDRAAQRAESEAERDDARTKLPRMPTQR